MYDFWPWSSGHIMIERFQDRGKEGTFIGDRLGTLGAAIIDFGIVAA